MFIYIFPYIGQLTDNYHCDGGLIVAANGGIERVKELIEQRNIADARGYVDYKGIQPNEDEFASVIICKIEGEAPEAVFVFPDAGCC